MTDEPPKDPPAPGTVVGSASSVETAPTAGERTPGEQTVEVADALRSGPTLEPVPVSDPPSGDMRPLDMTHASDVVAAVPAGYEAAPLSYDAPSRGDDAKSRRDEGRSRGDDAMPRSDEGRSRGDDGTLRSDDEPVRSDEAILPAALDDNALRDAVGAPQIRAARMERRDDDDDDDGVRRPGGRRVLAIGALALVAGLAITAFVLLGRVNAQRYVIACATNQVSAEQGRSFPPWGTRPLIGAEWRPINLPANAECRPRETDDRGELEKWFLELLVERASTTLTARNLLESIQPGKTNPLDTVAEQLNQALLLSRAPERRDQRKDVERLLGDIQYWRASLRLRDAAAALGDAARQFDEAAAQRPRHVTDAGEWATFLRRLVDELHAGPSGVPAAVVAPTGEPIGERPSAPTGTALPVEPDPSAPEPPAPPDAGLPTGGVLL